MPNITYRPLTTDDLPLRMKWINDPLVAQYLSFRGIDDLAFQQNWLKWYLEDESKEIFIIMADEKPIGQIGLLDIDLYDKNASLNIIIGEADYRGKGIGKEAIKHILNHAFNYLDLHKVWLDVHTENIAGIKCYTACGFIQEGRYIDQICEDDGHYADQFGMYILNPKHEKS